MGELIIRPLEEADVDSGLRECLGALSPTDAPSPQIFTSLWARKNARHYTFVAVQDGEVVGTASLLVEAKLSRDCRPAGHIEDVAVRPDRQGAGVGSKLVGHLLLRARALGCYKVVLDCDERKVGFYERAGFYRNGVAMRHDLDRDPGGD